LRLNGPARKWSCSGNISTSCALPNTGIAAVHAIYQDFTKEKSGDEQNELTENVNDSARAGYFSTWQLDNELGHWHSNNPHASKLGDISRPMVINRHSDEDNVYDVLCNYRFWAV
jgi:hypothetical protein